jgi:hypothetical protein
VTAGVAAHSDVRRLKPELQRSPRREPRRPQPRMGLCSAAQGCLARSRATLGTRIISDGNPERIVQIGPRVSANEGIFDVAVRLRLTQATARSDCAVVQARRKHAPEIVKCCRRQETLSHA